jgi:DsbC/DsbD-like thiol-disulfide interchange protein
MTTTISRLIPAAALLAGVLLFSGPALHGQAQEKKKTSADKVTVQATASKTDAAGNQQITMRLLIEKGWHIYANPLGNDEFTGNETKVFVTGQAQPADVKTAYPPGKMVEFAGAKVKIYDGEVTLVTYVRRAQGDNGPLQVRIKVNACNHDTLVCWPAGEITLNVPAYTQ